MDFLDAEMRKSDHVMVFGNSKSGKSTLVANLAEAGYNLRWFSLDGGHTVISKLSTEAKKRIKIWPIPDTADFPVATATLLKVSTGERVNLCDMHSQIDCPSCKRMNLGFSPVCLNDEDLNTIAIFDHVTHLAYSVENWLTNERPELASKKGDSSFERYRLHGQILAKFFINIQQARYNAVCIAQTLEAEMEDGKKCLFPDIGTRNFSTTAGSYFDHIVYTDVSNFKHGAGSSSLYKMNILTGSRRDIVVEKMDKPSLSACFTGLDKRRFAELNGEDGVDRLLGKVAGKVVGRAVENVSSHDVSSVDTSTDTSSNTVLSNGDINTNKLGEEDNGKDSKVDSISGTGSGNPGSSVLSKGSLSVLERAKAQLAEMNKAKI